MLFQSLSNHRGDTRPLPASLGPCGLSQLRRDHAAYVHEARQPSGVALGSGGEGVDHTTPHVQYTFPLEKPIPTTNISEIHSGAQGGTR